MLRFPKNERRKQILLGRNNTADRAVMDLGFRLTRTSVSGVFDGILMELVTEGVHEPRRVS